MKKIAWLLMAWLMAVAVAGADQTAAEPLRVLSLSAAATAVLDQLGVPPVAIDRYGLTAMPGGRALVIGRGEAVSREKLLEWKIQCAVLWYYQQESVERFRAQGIRCEVIPKLRLADYPVLVRRMGELTGRQAAADKLAAGFEAEMAALRAAPAERPVRVYFELYTPWKGAGHESYMGDLIRCAGGRSILPESGLSSPEFVVKAAPEVIFYVEGFGDAAEIAARPGMAAVPAVKKQRIIPVPRKWVVEGVDPASAIGFLRAGIRDR